MQFTRKTANTRILTNKQKQDLLRGDIKVAGL
jgi:hypothetical protein